MRLNKPSMERDGSTAPSATASSWSHSHSARASPRGSMALPKRWIRPLPLMKVPRFSTCAHPGSNTCAAAVVALGRMSETTRFPTRASVSDEMPALVTSSPSTTNVRIRPSSMPRAISGIVTPASVNDTPVSRAPWEFGFLSADTSRRSGSPSRATVSVNAPSLRAMRETSHSSSVVWRELATKATEPLGADPSKAASSAMADVQSDSAPRSSTLPRRSGR